MQTIEIIGQNYFGHWNRVRTACRGIVLRDGEILLSHETENGQYMIPGGGLETGETDAGCCAREVAEETGVLVKPGECALELEEYYEDYEKLPTKVTYRFENLIGLVEPVIKNEDGQVTAIDSSRDDSQYLRQCSEKERADLQRFGEGSVFS